MSCDVVLSHVGMPRIILHTQVATGGPIRRLQAGSRTASIRWLREPTFVSTMTRTSRRSPLRARVIVSAVNGPEPTTFEVLRGSGRDRERRVRRARVEVLLDNGKQVDVQPAQFFQHRLQSRCAIRRLGHRAPAHCLSKTQLLIADLTHNIRVDLLEVDVTDPLRKLSDDRDVVATAIGNMARVEAELYIRGIGVLKEPHDPVLRVDMTVGMWMKYEVDPVLLIDDLRELGHSRGQVAPLLGRQVDRLRHISVEVGIQLR